MPIPISLSDSELSAVMRACGPLAPADRDAFLRALLAHHPQFHIRPIGVEVQHGPKLPPFQRPRK